MEHVLWSFSGGAAEAIALFRAAEVSIEKGEKPTRIIGTSSGSITASIIPVAYEVPGFMEAAIKFAETLDVEDMFWSKAHRPLNEKGEPTFNAITRILTGHNHLGIQDIRDLFKELFTEEHVEILRNSPIKSFAFGVRGKDFKPTIVCLNRAKNVDDLVDMIELSSRISPLVQPAPYKGDTYVDGGFIAFNPGWLALSPKIKQYVATYAHPMNTIGHSNEEWDKNLFTVVPQLLGGMAHWHGMKDIKIEELMCKLYDIDYLRIECPSGYIDEIYESDDEQLIALGLASQENAIKAWDNKI
jgi:hypothetical protein